MFKLMLGNHEKIRSTFRLWRKKKIDLQNSILRELRSPNLRIIDRALCWDLKNPWDIAEKYHGEAKRAEKNSYDFTKSAFWLRFLGEVRTFFEEHLDATDADP